MSVNVHPTAVVHPHAQLAEGVQIGPYSVIGEHVQIGADTRVGPHVVIEGHTRIGARNQIFQFSSLGAQPQDKKYAGEPTRLEIGDDNTVREFCTFNAGTAQGGGVTRIGDRNWIMAYVHLAHDCLVGNNTIFANNAQLAGHVVVDDWVILGGFTVVHQFVSIGMHSMTAMGTILLQDLPAYVMASGNPAQPHGLNSEGLKRRGFTSAQISAIRRAYKTLYREGLGFAEAKAAIAAEAEKESALVPLADSLERATRGVIR